MAGKKTDAVVIGAGPGGYVAAIRLAQLGKKVTIVEKENLGGVCLNVGCIPSKALISAADFYDKLKNQSSTMGFEINGDVNVNMKTLVSWKNSVVEKLTGGIGFLLENRKVEKVTGEASFVSSKEIEVKSKNGTERIKADSFIIATGSRPIQIPGFEFDGKTIVDSTGALDLETVPEDLVVIGGGFIGVEIGTVFQKLGSKLTVVEMLDGILTGSDRDCVKVVERKLKKRKASILTKTKAKGVKKKGKKLSVTVETPKGDKDIPADVVLVTVGRRPNTESLNLKAAGVQLDERGFIKVNKKLETSAKGIYSIGDVAGGYQLAHKASKEGIVVAEVIAGKKSELDYQCMPWAVFSDPEIGQVGMTEEEAKKAGFTPKTGKFQFSANGRALSIGHAEGFVKVVGDEKTGLLLGVHIVGPEASDLIASAALGIEMGATVEDVALTVHTHPTLSECVMEAAEDFLGHAIHAV